MNWKVCQIPKKKQQFFKPTIALTHDFSVATRTSWHADSYPYHWLFLWSHMLQILPRYFKIKALCDLKTSFSSSFHFLWEALPMKDCQDRSIPVQWVCHELLLDPIQKYLQYLIVVSRFYDSMLSMFSGLGHIRSSTLHQQ